MGILSKLREWSAPEAWLLDRGYIAVKAGPLTWSYRRPVQASTYAAESVTESPQSAVSTDTGEQAPVWPESTTQDREVA